MEALQLAEKMAKILDNKKAENLSVIKIGEISSLADYFVIATGTSGTHVNSLADELEMKLKADGIVPMNIEGHRSRSWILMDYSHVIVHLFTQESRDFYDLDRLWTDGEKVEIDFSAE